MLYCKAPRYVKKAVEDLRRQLDVDKPGWTEHVWFCKWCRAEHTITPLWAVQARGAPRSQARRDNPAYRLRNPNWCPRHRISDTWLLTLCPHCQGELHCHLDDFGRAKSQQVLERCPRCRRESAIVPRRGVDVWRLRDHQRAENAVTAMVLDQGLPAIQQTLALR